MVEQRPPAYLAHAARSYVQIALLWVRAAMAYPVSFWMMTVSGLLITFLDFVTIWLMFTHIDAYGGFRLREIALLYGVTSIAFRTADMLVGSVEKIGQKVRSGDLDTMMTKPVPVLVQLCADRFELRRLGQIAQGVAVFAWAAPIVDWTPQRLLVLVLALVSGVAIYFCVFVIFSTIQFWTTDASEFANAFTYGGNTIMQYPMTIFPREVVRSLTYLLPLAFVNWYPCLFLLGRADPLGSPGWFPFASPLAALVLVGVTALVWRQGLRHYRSTGS
ncbi:ABC-2 type transport system permease protein [Nocardioides albertanoniae]|uniref:ABC-2 type transport system permease protein n=1 Tax=Nocardioides albertanoniae TaxID=1175486 RepID=A0A543A6L3_9ACTN|nr:ABC transporter permease [Nocardioides albertanoniae]TQL68207.1 ABC-2 type transport system permease protein [Nocardioides albertanoniae]